MSFFCINDNPCDEKSYTDKSYSYLLSQILTPGCNFSIRNDIPYK